MGLSPALRVFENGAADGGQRELALAYGLIDECAGLDPADANDGKAGMALEPACVLEKVTFAVPAFGPPPAAEPRRDIDETSMRSSPACSRSLTSELVSEATSPPGR